MYKSPAALLLFFLLVVPITVYATSATYNAALVAVENGIVIGGDSGDVEEDSLVFREGEAFIYPGAASVQGAQQVEFKADGAIGGPEEFLVLTSGSAGNLEIQVNGGDDPEVGPGSSSAEDLFVANGDSYASIYGDEAIVAAAIDIAFPSFDILCSVFTSFGGPEEENQFPMAISGTTSPRTQLVSSYKDISIAAIVQDGSNLNIEGGLIVHGNPSNDTERGTVELRTSSGSGVRVSKNGSITFSTGEL